MGVYIKGMEMPKGDYRTVEIAFDADGHPMAICGGDVYDVIPAPEHGRLGDIDKLIERLERQVDLHEKQAKRAEEKGTAGYTNDMYIVDRNRDLIGILKALSVVIPAEKAEKSEKAEKAEKDEKADTKIVYCKECQLVHNCPIQKQKDENEGNPFKEIIGCGEGVSVEK